MQAYADWVETTGYLVPPAADAWKAGWDEAIKRINALEFGV